MVALMPIEVSLTPGRRDGLTIPITVNLAQGDLSVEHGASVLNLNLNISVPVKTLLEHLASQEPDSPEVTAVGKLAKEAPLALQVQKTTEGESLAKTSSGSSRTDGPSISRQVSIHETMATKPAPSTLIKCSKRRIDVLPTATGSESGDKPEDTHPQAEIVTPKQPRLPQGPSSSADLKGFPQGSEEAPKQGDDCRRPPEVMWAGPADAASSVSASTYTNDILSNLWEDDWHRDTLSGDLASLGRNDEDSANSSADCAAPVARAVRPWSLSQATLRSHRTDPGMISRSGTRSGDLPVVSRSGDLPVAFRRPAKSAICGGNHTASQKLSSVGNFEVMRTLSERVRISKKSGAAGAQHREVKSEGKLEMEFEPDSPVKRGNGSLWQSNLEDMGAKYGEQLCVKNISKDACLWSIKAGLKRILGDLPMKDCQVDAAGEAQVTFESVAAARQACARLAGQTVCGSLVEVCQVCQA